MKTNYIVYQAYGSVDILNEALYSILSFYKVHGIEQNDIQLVLYTDNVAHFESIIGKGKILFKEINAELLKKWRGDIDFVHRVKIEILIDFSTELEQDNVLYLDSDICVLKPATEIFEGISKGIFYMHDSEGSLSESDFRLILKLGKFIKSHHSQLRALGFDVPLATKTWNAGVIGFNASKKNVLKKVLCFTDNVYKIYPKHIIEQFGFSFYLGKEAEVVSTSDCFYHYWSFKEFRQVLNDFFEHHKTSKLETLISELDLISPIKIGEPKRIYDAMHWLPKAFRKMKKNRWIMPNYKYWER